MDNQWETAFEKQLRNSGTGSVAGHTVTAHNYKSGFSIATYAIEYVGLLDAFSSIKDNDKMKYIFKGKLHVNILNIRQIF